MANAGADQPRSSIRATRSVSGSTMYTALRNRPTFTSRVQHHYHSEREHQLHIVRNLTSEISRLFHNICCSIGSWIDHQHSASGRSPRTTCLVTFAKRARRGYCRYCDYCQSQNPSFESIFSRSTLTTHLTHLL